MNSKVVIPSGARNLYSRYNRGEHRDASLDIFDYSTKTRRNLPGSNHVT
jgi:hypothetical protein